MITITNLSKSYSNSQVVDNLSLEIQKGTIFGFLGPNGAGKTTTMKMIVGLSTIDKGAVEVDGRDLKRIKARENIGYMPEDPYFYERLNAIEFLNFMRSLFPQTNLANSKIKIPNAKQIPNKKQARNTKYEIRNMELLDLVGLNSVGKKRIGDFSKGMKQRLGLAQALVNDPDYLFLDEPLDGLDPIGRREFKKIFLDLKKAGKTIFFNSHVLSDVEEICDNIGIINQGKLIYSGPIKPFCKSTTLEKKFVEIITSKTARQQIG